MPVPRKSKPRPKKAARRGRPPGSIKLPPDKRQLLLAAVEAGGSDHRCARAAGIDPRTFRTWRQIAEGRHPTRKPTKELVEIFREIDEAAARATIRQEIKVAQTDPKHWLRYRARSQPGLDGWTEPVPEEPGAQDPIHAMSADELQQVVSTLLVSGAVELAPCSDPSCTCTYHGVRGEEGEADEAL